MMKINSLLGERTQQNATLWRLEQLDTGHWGLKRRILFPALRLVKSPNLLWYYQPLFFNLQLIKALAKMKNSSRAMHTTRTLPLLPLLLAGENNDYLRNTVYVGRRHQGGPQEVLK